MPTDASDRGVESKPLSDRIHQGAIQAALDVAACIIAGIGLLAVIAIMVYLVATANMVGS